MAATVTEAGTPDLSFKVAATDIDAPGTVQVDEDEGIVEAIVSVTGVEDEVADIIEPGAYKATLTARKPKVVWHHNWDQPIGRILHIEELPPGDSRLPAATKDGKQWPKAAGGLLATMQFNLKSTRGREAFEAVRFYSETGECEWSIGYSVPSGASTKDKTGVRHIKALDLYEISYVLFGAASQTGTLSLKAAVQQARERKATSGGDPVDSSNPPEGFETVDPPAGTEPVEEPDGLTQPDELERKEDGVKRAFSNDKRQEMAKRGHAMSDGSYPIENESDLRNAIQAYGRASNKDAVKAHIVKRAKALGLTRLLPDGWDSSGKAQPSGANAAAAPNIPTEPAVDDSVDSVDSVDDTETATDNAVAAEILAEADGWATDDPAAEVDGLDDSDRQMIRSLADEAKAISPGGRPADDSPVGTPGGRQNWVDKVGGLPKYIRMVAHALIRQGKTESRAISIAVATMKKWARGGGNVSPKVQAAAAAALAEWEAKKTASHAKSVERVGQWNPWYEQGEFASTKQVTPTSSQDFPRIEGTFEERISLVRDAVCQALMDTYTGGDNTDSGGDSGGDGSWSHVAIEGTWPDRVIATCHKWSDGPTETESYEMNYTIGDDGSVTLSEPQPVKLTVYVEPVDGDQSAPDIPLGDMLPVPDMVETAAYGAKALLFASQQQKAGRVLSGINEARLKAALESLIAVLRAAGIELDSRPGPVRPPQFDDQSTAPSAQAKHLVTIPSDEVAALLAELNP